MEKVITAVVTSLLCSFFSGEEQGSKVSEKETKQTIKVESVEPKKLSETKDAVHFDSVEADID